MSDREPPVIEFPCQDYPIKVMGDACDELHVHVVKVFSKHVEDFDVDTMRVRASAQGRYQSITVSITATGTEQLQAIFEDLKLSDAVKMVL